LDSSYNSEAWLDVKKKLLLLNDMDYEDKEKLMIRNSSHFSGISSCLFILGISENG